MPEPCGLPEISQNQIPRNWRFRSEYNSVARGQIGALYLVVVFAVGVTTWILAHSWVAGVSILVIGFVLLVVVSFSLDKRRKYLEEEALRNYLLSQDIRPPERLFK